MSDEKLEFPKELYVTRNGDDPPQYFGVKELADEENIRDGDEVAIYELKRVGNAQITRTVVE